MRHYIFHGASHWLNAKVALDNFTSPFGGFTFQLEYKVSPVPCIFRRLNLRQIS